MLFATCILYDSPYLKENEKLVLTTDFFAVLVVLLLIVWPLRHLGSI